MIFPVFKNIGFLRILGPTKHGGNHASWWIRDFWSKGVSLILRFWLIFFRFSKKSDFGVFLVLPTMVSVLLSASVKRCFVSRMRDFKKIKLEKNKGQSFSGFLRKTKLFRKCLSALWSGWFSICWSWYRCLYCQCDDFYQKYLSNFFRIRLDELLKVTTHNCMAAADSVVVLF